MGEMADMALYEVIDYEEARSDFRTGKLNIFEAFECCVVDELGYEYSPQHKRSHKMKAIYGDFIGVTNG